MATLLGPWQRALDDTAAPIPGAKLYTFDSVATSTPKTTYADPDLTTPHTNPVVADAFGNFPQIFAETGDSFYLVLRTATDVLVEDYEAVDALGELGTGALARDFGLNGRWQVRASAGQIYEEFGPPEGDDVGGNAIISGWNGTEMEGLEVRSAETSFTGSVSFDGGVDFAPANAPSGVPVVLASGVAATAADITIEIPDGYSDLRLRLQRLSGSAAAANTPLRARFSYDGATTWLQTSGAYGGTNIEINNSAGLTTSGGSATQMTLGANWDPDGETTAVVDVLLQTATSTRTGVSGHAWGSQSKVIVAQNTSATQPKATHVQIYFDTGTINAEWRLIATKD